MNGIPRWGLGFAAAVAFLAFAAGCSNSVLGVVQSFGLPNGAKIRTIAGNGTGGYAGDGGPATSAELHQPYAVAVDSSGSLYIADGLNCVIRKVDASGTITTFAGDFSRGGTYFGDIGLATSAGLNGPVGLAIYQGNLYISDTLNQRIRMVTAGTITTVAGTGMEGYTGDGGLATAAKLSLPYGIAVDSGGNLYIADSGNSCIRKVNAIGHISTVAGTGIAGYTGDGRAANTAELNFPQAIAVDISNNLYIADTDNCVIRKVDQASGTISTVAGNGVVGYSGDGGQATAAELYYVWGVTVDSSGNLYISESNSVVRKVDTNGIISTVAGNVHLGAGYGGDGNVATAALLNEPWGLGIDLSGNLLIADRINNRIRKVGFGN